MPGRGDEGVMGDGRQRGDELPWGDGRMLNWGDEGMLEVAANSKLPQFFEVMNLGD